MKRNILVFGLIAGTIVSAMMFTGMLIFDFCSSGDMVSGMLYGYSSMLLAFIFVFVGIRNYREKYNDGIITFGKAFKIGFWIMLIASTMYVITWMIESSIFFPDFAEKYAAMEIERMKASGATEAAIQAQMTEMASFQEMYKNPVFKVLMTYLEILPVGLIITAASALILKRKNKPAAV